MESVNRTNGGSCSGCGVCAAVCPRGAITMELNQAGFLHPVVREELCVRCGLCQAVCGRFSREDGGLTLYDGTLYALQTGNEDTLRRCSSGGIAHELALWAVENGGRAVGAVYDRETNTVRHEAVDRVEDISRLDGSKYLQSRTEDAFREVLRSRAGENWVVFGTPCQISALAAATEKAGIRDRLLLVEIFCHGVPSYRVWEESLKQVKKELGTDRFDSVRFRYKKDDWHSYCLRVEGNGKIWYGRRETALFWQVFFENVLLGDACQTCTARKERTRGDLRLGDYWGGRFRDRTDGVSAVVACTDRGRAAVETLLKLGRVRDLGASDMQEMLRAQNMAGYARDGLHEQAMEVLKTGGVRAAVAYYRRRQTPKQKLRRAALRVSGILPDPLRAKLRKCYSAVAWRTGEKKEG